MKNCGQTVHDEVANKQTMEELKELLKVGPGGEDTVTPRPCLCLSGALLAPEAVAGPGRTEDRKVGVGGPRTSQIPAR